MLIIYGLRKKSNMLLLWKKQFEKQIEKANVKDHFKHNKIGHEISAKLETENFKKKNYT
jgi:hypothetical protein